MRQIRTLIPSLCFGLTLLCCMLAQPALAAEIYSAAYGKASDPAVIFLHGGPGYNSLDFEVTTAQKLADQGFYVLVYDRRGEGRSRAVPNNKYTFAEASDDLTGLYKKYHLQQASLLGHSFGGTVAVKFAQAHSQMVRQLIWIGSPLSYPTLLKTIQTHCRERYTQQKNQINLSYLDRLAEMPPDSLDYSGYSFMHGLNCGLYQPAHPSKESLKLYQDLGHHPSFAAANLPAQAPIQGFYDHEHYTTMEISQALAEVKTKLPVYGLYGNEDGLFDPAHLQAIAKIIGPDHLVTVPGSSHNIYVDQQPAFLEQIVKWLKAPGLQAQEVR